MPRRIPCSVIAGLSLLLVLTATCAGAQVQLISPADGSEADSGTAEGIILRWEAYPGAQSYRCYNLTDDGNYTWPMPLENNPHLVSSGQLSYVIRTTLDNWWNWRIIAYSDTQGQNQIAISDTWTFFATLNPEPTATPTPLDSLDFNSDGKEDGVDLFYFANLWYQDTLDVINQPGSRYFQKANVYQTETGVQEIDKMDLITLKELFRNRKGPQDAPALPPPILRWPADFEIVRVPSLNNDERLFAWYPLDGADHYKIRFVGLQSGTFETPDTEFYTANASGKYQITTKDNIQWSVCGVTADGKEGEWSSIRTVVAKQIYDPDPADMYQDGQINYLDIFQLAYRWQTQKGIDAAYRSTADLAEPNEIIDANDFLTFISEYHLQRSSEFSCDLPAPRITGPDSGIVYTPTQVRNGEAGITWTDVSSAVEYMLIFRSSSGQYVIQKQQPGYVLTEAELYNTIIAGGLPVTVTVQSRCANGSYGEPSEPITITILTTSN